MAQVKKQITAPILFLLGALCQLGLHAEFLLIEAETYIFDKEYTDFTITESVTHWIVTCVMWGIVGLVMFYIATRVYGMNILQKERKPSQRGIVIALMLLSSSVGVKYLLLGGWQFIIDFRNQGWFQFIFLYIYYLFEASLLLLSAVFFQEAVEHIAKKKYDHIPWGGAVLALTWGAAHFITTWNITTALFYTAAAFFVGCAYLAAKRNLYTSYLFAAILIIL